MREKPICGVCGAEEISFDANAVWDVEAQDWIVGGICDTAWCSACNDETEVKWVEA